MGKKENKKEQSPLEQITELSQEAQKELSKITQERTTIVIAHRLSTIKNADNIVVIDKGKIVESGKHEKLLDQNKIYADLWNVQVGI